MSLEKNVDAIPPVTQYDDAMYTPSAFEVHDRAALLRLCADHPFGMLMAQTSEGIELSHLPFMVHDDGRTVRVRCHVARSNPLASIAAQSPRMTAVFSGPHGYVSPQWYAQPERQVPTWNYMVVHAEGTARAMDEHALESFIEALSRHYEPSEGWTLQGVDAEYRRDLMRGIVGIELEIDAFVGKFKLSQNRSPVDQARVRDALQARGTTSDREMAAWMKGR